MTTILIVVGFIIAISAVAAVLENVTDRKMWRGLLIGGGSTILVFAAAAHFLH